MPTYALQSHDFRNTTPRPASNFCPPVTAKRVVHVSERYWCLTALRRASFGYLLRARPGRYYANDQTPQLSFSKKVDSPLFTEAAIFFLFLGLPITLLAAVIACPFLTRRLRSKGRPVLANVCIAMGVITAFALLAYFVALGDFHMFLSRSWLASL